MTTYDQIQKLKSKPNIDINYPDGGQESRICNNPRLFILYVMVREYVRDLVTTCSNAKSMQDFETQRH